MDESNTRWRLGQRDPFGVTVSPDMGAATLADIPVETVRRWVRQYRLVVLRGFVPPAGEALVEFGKTLGPIQEWEFGAVNNLEARPDAKNYLYTNREVPFHWDGAFAGRIPGVIVFHCEQAPDAASGGETLFCDTVALLRQAEPETKARWQGIEITYSTDKLAHYGGSFTAPLLGHHPQTREEVVRFAEPVHDLNPVRLEIHGIPPAEHEAFLQDMHVRLRAPQFCVAHVWAEDDIVLADNHALLHGRNAFKAASARRLRRVNVF
jgi:alpha-ketoglutarate-dependent taurine dioxygenase